MDYHYFSNSYRSILQLLSERERSPLGPPIFNAVKARSNILCNNLNNLFQWNTAGYYTPDR